MNGPGRRATAGGAGGPDDLPRRCRPAMVAAAAAISGAARSSGQVGRGAPRPASNADCSAGIVRSSDRTARSGRRGHVSGTGEGGGLFMGTVPSRGPGGSQLAAARLFGSATSRGGLF